MQGVRSTISVVSAVGRAAKDGAGSREPRPGRPFGGGAAAGFAACGATTWSSACDSFPALGSTHHQPSPLMSALPGGRPIGRSLPLAGSLTLRMTRRGPSMSSLPSRQRSRRLATSRFSAASTRCRLSLVIGVRTSPPAPSRRAIARSASPWMVRAVCSTTWRSVTGTPSASGFPSRPMRERRAVT